MTTVRQLIEALEFYPDDMEVQFAYSYGDHVGSIVACDINTNDVEKGKVMYSEYHQQDKVVESDYHDKYLPDEVDEDDSDEVREVILIQ